MTNKNTLIELSAPKDGINKRQHSMASLNEIGKSRKVSSLKTIKGLVSIFLKKTKHTFLAAAFSVAAFSERSFLALFFFRRDSGGKISCLVGTVLKKSISIQAQRNQDKIPIWTSVHFDTSWKISLPLYLIQDKNQGQRLASKQEKTNIDERINPIQCYVCSNYFKANHTRMVSSTHFI